MNTSTLSPNTNPIGAGTINRTTNLPKPLDAQIGQLAFQSNMSASEYIRELLKQSASLGVVLTKKVQESALPIIMLTLLMPGALTPISEDDILRARRTPWTARVAKPVARPKKNQNLTTFI